MSQHATLSPERFSTFSRDQQVLMIANEMNRAGKLLEPDHLDRRRNSYERVLNLTDLTIRVQPGKSFRREILRWRDLVAELYVAERPEKAAHAAALRALLRLTPEASKQLAALS